MTTIESDFKRLVQNAKDYNEPESLIYEDAEKIRKLVFNFMKQNNLAYREDSNYSSFPTPLPKAGSGPSQNGVKSTSPDQANDKSKRSSTARASEQPDKKPSVAPSATTGDGEGDVDGDEDGGEAGGVDLDLTGKTFQEAQQMMISHLLHYTDDE